MSKLIGVSLLLPYALLHQHRLPYILSQRVIMILLSSNIMLAYQRGALFCRWCRCELNCGRHLLRQ